MQNRSDNSEQIRKIYSDADVEAALDIENACERPYPKRKRRDFYKLLLPAYCAGLDHDLAGWVVEWTTKGVIAFCVQQLMHLGPLANTDDCLQPGDLYLIDIAVHPNYQRQHVATRIIERLKQMLASQKNTVRIVTDVRESDISAQYFFKANGFKATKVLNNYFEKGNETSYRFIWPPPETNDEYFRIREVDEIPVDEIYLV